MNKAADPNSRARRMRLVGLLAALAAASFPCPAVGQDADNDGPFRIGNVVWGDAPDGIDFITADDTIPPPAVMWDGSHAYVPNRDEGTISIVDLLNDETDATVEACPGPADGALTPDQVTDIVACGGSDELVFINTASFAVTGRVSEGLGARPSSIVVPAPGRYALVYNADGGTVSVVDLEARAVVQTIDVGVQPLVLRLGPDPDRPDGQRVHVSNQVAGSFVELVPVAEPVELRPAGEAVPLNEVVVLGMIHGQHETSESFSLKVVRDLVREIDPDYWLTEIPPNRWDRAWAEYQATGTVEEPRVRRFPEYMQGLFPLSRELDFEVIPTAGWTQPMSDFRGRVSGREFNGPGAGRWTCTAVRVCGFC